MAAFLYSVGALSALATFLAILMVIAENTIGNYGEVNITINGSEQMTVSGGRPLLSTLMEEKLFIPSACGGRGSCGFCTVKVTSDIGDYLATELPWISDGEKKENIRLACQVKVKKDIAIEIPEELFNVKEYRTKVISLRDLTHDIKEVKLKLLEPDQINVKAGQYVQFQVPEYEQSAESVYRAYSLASPPSEKGSVELEIRLVPSGLCTTYVHQYLKEGDEVILNGPYGEFFLQESEREAVCIAGGSGMAPIKAILLDMLDKNIDRKVSYFFGAVTRKDLFLVEEMEELQKKLPRFRFIPALSSPAEGDDWQGETGLITEVLARHLENAGNTEAYLCGSPGMIDACIEVLAKKGIPEELIFYDKFA